MFSITAYLKGLLNIGLLTTENVAKPIQINGY